MKLIKKIFFNKLLYYSLLNILFIFLFLSCGSYLDETAGLTPVNSKEITSFMFSHLVNDNIDMDSTSSIIGTEIKLIVPSGTNITSLVASFSTTGKSVKIGNIIQKSGFTPNDYSHPVVYTVIARDGSTKDYIVKTIITPDSSKEIISFYFRADDNNQLSSDIIASISGNNILATVPYGTDVTGLVATFTTTGTLVRIDENIQQSGLTINDFTGSVIYTVTAGDGRTLDYTVVVLIAPQVVVDVTGIILNKQSATIIIGFSEQLNANILPTNATNLSITWVSDNELVAIVSANGLVTAISEGNAIITATTDDGGYTATCDITVIKIDVTGIALNKGSTTIEIGSTEQLTATIEPVNATNQNVIWSSDNETVVTVSQNGVVTTHSIGTAVISVETVDGGFTQTCEITVIPVAVTSITLNKTSTSIDIGQTEQLSFNIVPSNATNRNVTWSTSDESIAMVSATGLVTALDTGLVTITVTTEDEGFTSSCDVKVNLWTHLYGSDYVDYARGVTIDNNDNIYIIGENYSDFDGNLNSGASDILIIKLDTGGNKQWSRLLGSTQGDFAYGIAVDINGNIYLTGYTTGEIDGNPNAGGYDIFVAKYDSNGNKLWVRLLGSPGSDYGRGISVDGSGNSYIAGYTDGSFGGQSNIGYTDIFITKYDTNGNFQWTRFLGYLGVDYGYAIATDSSGNSFVTGNTLGYFDGQISNGSIDVVVAKYDTNGNKLWTRLLGSVDNDYGEGISTDGNGNCYITGNTRGSWDSQINTGWKDVFITKFNGGGTHQWTRLLGGYNDEGGRSIYTDSDGNSYITGYTKGDIEDEVFSGGSTDFFITKYNTNGVRQWVRLNGSLESDVAFGVSADSNGNSYVTGYSYGDLNGQSNQGISDIFVVKFDINGNN